MCLWLCGFVCVFVVFVFCCFVYLFSSTIKSYGYVLTYKSQCVESDQFVLGLPFVFRK